MYVRSPWQVLHISTGWIRFILWCVSGHWGSLHSVGLDTQINFITEYGSERASLVAQTVKNPPAMQETWVWSLDQEDSPGEGNGNPLQNSCLGNPIDGGAWWATYSPRGCKESDVTEQLALHSHSSEEVQWDEPYQRGRIRTVLRSSVFFWRH